MERGVEKDLELSIFKFLWQASPISKKRVDTVPGFLKHLLLFKDFNTLELYKVNKHLHPRTFEGDEVVFSQGDSGVGFYLIFSGHIEIFMSTQDEEPGTDN